MAVGAGSPELKLSVGFDLAYFRNQLPTLGAAASSYSLPINIHFNRLGIQEEFNKLGRNISGRQYNLKVEVKSLESALKQARELQLILSETKGRSVRSATLQKTTGRDSSGKVRLKVDELKTVYAAAAKAGIEGLSGNLKQSRPALEKELNAAFAGAADNALKGLINGLVKGEDDLRAASKALGDALVDELDKSLEIKSPSKRTERIGRYAAQGFWMGLIKEGAKWERAAAADIRGRVDRALKGVNDYAKSKTLDLTVAVQVEFELKSGALAKFGSELAISATKSVTGALAKASRDSLTSGVSSAIDTATNPLSLIATAGGAVTAGGWESIHDVLKLVEHFTSGASSPYSQETILATMEKIGELVAVHGAEGALATVTAIAGTGFAVGATKGFATSMVAQTIEGAADLTVGKVVVSVVGNIKKIPSLVGSIFAKASDGFSALVLKGQEDIGGLTTSKTSDLFRETVGNFLIAAAERGKVLSAKNAPRIAAGIETGVVTGARALGTGFTIGGKAAGAGLKAGWENSLEQRISLIGQALTKVNQALNFLEDVAIKGAVDIQGLTDGTTIAATKQALLGYKATLEIGAAQLRDFHAALKPGNIERVAVREMLSPQVERVAGQRLLPPIGQSSAGIHRQYTVPAALPPGSELASSVKTTDSFLGRLKAQLENAKNAFQKNSALFVQAIKDKYQNIASSVQGDIASAGNSINVIRQGISGGFGRMPGGVAFGGGGGNPPRGQGGGGSNPPNGPIGGGFFPSAGMHIPSTQLGAGYHTVNKGISAIGNAYGGVKSFLNTSQLPLSGAIADLGGEFGNAVKQVLLFGTAYKAIAFLQNVPGEAFNAAKGLATYRNQLQAITSESGTFEQSFAFVEGLAQRFNVPLESARQGFVRLYASMQPAGFDQGQIESLFTGISQSAAAFGLSSDQVDRVTNAFSQMASKGQIMAEEVKGQLGDVLPGALSLFAKAAQMSLPGFTKAMEDGRFKGAAMAAVLDNVGVLLSNKFGPAAQGAAKTLQGAVNQINNNLKLMYESLTPIVNNIAAAFGPEINSLIADVTSTVKALTSTFTSAGEGFGALTPRAQGFYLAVKEIEPSLRQAGAAIADLAGRFQTLLPAIVSAISLAISFAASPLGRAAIIAAVGVGTLTAAFKLLEVTGLEAALRSVYRFITSLTGLKQATGLARLGVISLKLVLTGVFIGAVLVGLDFLVGKILDIGNAANQSRKDLANLKQTLDQIAGSGDVESATKEYLDANTKLARARAEYAARQREATALSSAQQGEASGSEQPNPVTSFLSAQATAEADKAYALVIQSQKALQAARQTRATALRIAQDRDKQTQATLKPIPPSEDTKKAKSMESFYKLEDDLARAITDGEIDRANMLFEHRKNLLNTYYDIQDARANSFQKETIKFQREIANIEMDRQKSALDAQNAVKKIEGSVAGGATGLLQGSTGTADGAHFHVKRKDGSYLSPAEARAIFDPSIAKTLSMTSSYGARNTGIPGASTYHTGVDLAGKANTPLSLASGYNLTGVQRRGGLGNTASISGPRGQSYEVGHLQDPTAGILRKVGSNEGRGIRAAAKTQIELQKEGLALKYADILAAERQKVAMENYVAAIMPLAEQKLQNQLLAQRNQLQLSGAGDAEIEQKTKVYELDIRKADLEESINALKKKGESTSLSKVEATQLDLETKALAELNANYLQYIANLAEARRLKAESAYASNVSSLRDQLQLAGIIDPYAELRQKYIQADQTPAQADAQVKLQQQIDLVTRLRDGYRAVADAIGNSFGEAFKGIVSGSMTAQQALSQMFQSIASSFMDMVAQMIASWIKAQAVKGITSLIGMIIPGFGASPDAGLSNLNAPASINNPLGVMPVQANAKGGILAGGFRAFASGGVVTGPTLGLVGEGRYNEAVIPLPDGKSVPVDLGGAGGGGQITSNIVVNVNSDGQSQSQQSGNGSAELGKKIEGAVKQVIVGELRPGGLLAGRR